MSPDVNREAVQHWSTQLRQQIAATAVVVGSILTGCSTTEPAPAPLERSEWTVPVEVSSAIPVYPDCLPLQPGTPIGQYELDPPFDPAKDRRLSNQAEGFIAANPTLEPVELANTYLAAQAERLGANQFALAFDEGVISPTWADTHIPMLDEVELGEEMELKNKKLLLLAQIETLVLAVNEYPNSLLQSLGIDTIRLGNIYENFGGHFDRTNREIRVEFDILGNTKSSLSNVRTILSHELLGHAAHSIYCQGNIHADQEISVLNGAASYLGRPNGESMTIEELKAYYAQIPAEQLAYGPDRAFAREYGATSVTEDVATIVEFTTDKRGLIKEGDADFGSPLQKKQAAIMERMEQILPGFKAFVEQRTKILRRVPTNEIHMATAANLVIPPELLPDAATYDPNDIYSKPLRESTGNLAMLNGVVYREYEQARGGVFLTYPIVSLDPNGQIVSYHFEGERMSGSVPLKADQGNLVFYRGALGEADIIPITYQEAKKHYLSSFDIDSPAADEFFATNPPLLAYTRNS